MLKAHDEAIMVATATTVLPEVFVDLHKHAPPKAGDLVPVTNRGYGFAGRNDPRETEQGKRILWKFAFHDPILERMLPPQPTFVYVRLVERRPGALL